jgi:trimeric autotransporter adhesin
MKNRDITFATTILFALGLFALPLRIQAVGPDTEGSISGANNGEGVGVLVSRTTGIWNTGTGFEALNHLTTGNQNTATGLRAMFNDTSGGFNTATGVLSLFSNTNGFFNTATGAYSLANNTASGNTAHGYSALYNNATGERNTATGYAALYRNTGGPTFGSGGFNTANGYQALFSNTTGTGNVANGYAALYSSDSDYNTANGFAALSNNTTGAGNTAIGRSALQVNTAGSNNSALGHAAGSNLTTGDGNVCLGAEVRGVPGESNTTWIRNINTTTQNFSAGVNNYVTVRLSDGRLGHTAVVSSRRYKEEIKPLDKISEALYALNPVSFRFKKKYDETQALGFGLIAEEVEKVDPDLVYHNNKGQVESVRYEMVNAMLLNEFLKAHRKMEEQEASITQLNFTVAQQRKDFEARIAQQQREMDALMAQLKEQDSTIQKVSDQLAAASPSGGGLEVSKFATGQIRCGGPAPKIVSNNK